jgi:fatty-acyl-CoA synthase
VREANVYGVCIEGCDGRAGMAALVADPGTDLEALRRHIEARLPAYARPLFLRLVPEIEHTGTFKQRKVDLVKEGFDPRAISDEIYFASPETGRIERLDEALYARIQSGAVRL